MSKNHTHDLSIELIGAAASMEVVASYEFTYSPGCPATGPSYASGGDHAEPAEIEVVAVDLHEVVNGKTGSRLECPAWLREWLIETADLSALEEGVDLEREESF
jgi:hypothetical protein